MPSHDESLPQFSPAGVEKQTRRGVTASPDSPFAVFALFAHILVYKYPPGAFPALPMGGVATTATPVKCGDYDDLKLGHHQKEGLDKWHHTVSQTLW